MTSFKHKFQKGETDLWSSPPELLKTALGNLTYWDPCPEKPEWDGLLLDWQQMLNATKKDVVYVNPPFSEASRWVRKAGVEIDKGVPLVMLLPVRSHCSYFQDVVLQDGVKLHFLPKGTAFIRQSTGKQALPFHNSLVLAYFNIEKPPFRKGGNFAEVNIY